MDTKTKILVVGDVRGQFKQLFQRVNTVNKKAGPFEIVLCVGDFFGSNEQNAELNEYKNGTKTVTVPTYILGPNKPEHQPNYDQLVDNEICKNITYLGKRGLYTLSCGTKIAYLSGTAAENVSDECHFNKDDVLAICNSCLVRKTVPTDYRGVDILLTSQWPFGIDEAQNATASKLLSYLCKEIKPRYHFCALNNINLEPPPHRIPADETTQLSLCTRFVALAEVGNASKAKYIYALSLTPVAKMRVTDLLQKTTDEVVCPYINLDYGNNSLKVNKADQQQYFYDMNAPNNRKRHNNGQQKRAKIMHIDQEKCWFCLSSPDIEKHLVITVGDNFYLALAKGPINDFHVLIMSTTHIPAAALLSESDWEELNKFKKALRKFFKCQGQVVCFTERNYKSAHLQINVLGIDEGYAWKIQHSFEDKAEEYNLQFENLPPLDSAEILPQKGPYFVAELPDDTVIITRQMKHFPLHFARDVFCSENLLNCEEKVNWKDCLLDKEKELSLVETFRSKFAPFDFTD